MSTTFNIEAGHLLRPQAGDLMVFTTERRITRDQAEAFSAVMQVQLPGVKALLLQDGMQLAAIHTNEEIKRLLAKLPAKAEPAPEPFNLDTACQQAMERVSRHIEERSRYMQSVTGAAFFRSRERLSKGAAA